MKLVVTGGIYPSNWQKIQEKNQENFIRFSEAEMLEVDWDTGECLKRIKYQSPPDSINPSMMFKGAQIFGNQLNVVTNTELVSYDINNWLVNRVVTDKSFNDLHGVLEEDDKLWIVNTGLEIIQLLEKDGRIIKEWNFANAPTWERFEKECDYRKLGSTKPHEAHINHIFSVNGEYYVTRMLLKDAVGLENPAQRFDVGVGNPHDGIVKFGRVYFTTTNGHVVVFDAFNRQKIAVVDLNEALIKSGMQSGGWCRGLCAITENRVVVGYTQLRHTKFKEFVSWAKKLGNNPAPTRLIEFDLQKKLAVKEHIYASRQGVAIFSVLQI